MLALLRVLAVLEVLICTAVAWVLLKQGTQPEGAIMVGVALFGAVLFTSLFIKDRT